MEPKKYLNVWRGNILLPEALEVEALFEETPDAQGNPVVQLPYGPYSRASATHIIDHMGLRNNHMQSNPISVDDAISAMVQFQDWIEGHASKELASPLIARNKALKRFGMDAIQDQIYGQRSTIDQLQNWSGDVIEQMLLMEESGFPFMQGLQQTGIISSANLGIGEALVLYHASFLRQAAQDGHQAEFHIKPPLQMPTYHDLLEGVPQQFRTAYNIITLKSGLEWPTDRSIMPDMMRAIEAHDGGALFFGKRSTSQMFQGMLQDPSNPHFRFYHDHFPLIYVGEHATEEQLDAISYLAVSLADYLNGQACLSVQVVGAHPKVFDRLESKINEQREYASNGQNGYPTRSGFTDDEWIENSSLARSLNGQRIVYGIEDLDAYADSRTLPIFLACNVPIGFPVIGQENGFPLITLVKEEDYGFQKGMLEQLGPENPQRLSDKHVYIIGVGIGPDSPVIDYALQHAHRFVYVGPEDGRKRIDDFVVYGPGTPHCDNTFLRDYFGLPPLGDCYLDHPLPSREIT